MQTFRHLDAPYVFISAPGDLNYLRQIAWREFDSVRKRVANDYGLAIYDWLIDKAKDGFKDWIPAQAQIPLPSDPNCRALLCMLGERIGTPLPEDFDLTALGEYASDTANSGYRLVHPWVPGAERTGGFSLTGTTFEFLAALNSNKTVVSAADLERGKPPVKLLFIGDASIRGDDDPRNASWGWHKLYEKSFTNPDFKPAQRTEWEEKRYLVDLHQLRNFLRFIEKRGIVCDIAESIDEARTTIRGFLSLVFGVRGVSQRDPFKGLFAFDEEDESIFFGRDSERTHAIAELVRITADPNAVPFFGVVGGSGVGKSSFLRAGLIPSLKNDTSKGSFRACIVRPGDLLSMGASEYLATGNQPFESPLQRLLSIALTSIDKSINTADVFAQIDRLKEQEQPREAVLKITEALDANGESDSHLLIGFDQFEEIIDQRLNKKIEMLWRPVIDFIAAAVASRRIIILYTLQMNRGDLVSRDAVLGPLFTRGGVRQLGFPAQSLEEITHRPFEYCGLSLEPALSRELLNRIRTFAGKPDSADIQASLLPLISLTLRRLYEAKGITLLKNTEAGKDNDSQTHEGGSEEGSSQRMLRLADCEEYLDIAGAITKLAEDATKDAQENLGPDWSDDTIGGLLRRLVRHPDVNEDLLSLVENTLPSTGALKQLAESLLKRRLLVRTSETTRIRLVHEAVIRYWPNAAAWLQEERSLLAQAAQIASIAGLWIAQGRPDALLLPEQVDAAAGLLSRWFDALSPVASTHVEPKDERVREYSLALLRKYPSPTRIVESSTYKSPHVHLAPLYSDYGLLKRYIEVDPGCVHTERSDGRTAIYNAAFIPDVSLTQLLIDAGADVDHPDNEGWRPVHGAAVSGQLDTLNLLLDRGANPASVGGPSACNALHLASMDGHSSFVSRLLNESRVNPASRTADSWTSLHLAGRNGHTDTVLVLLAHPGSNPGAETNDGWSAFHLACRYGDGAMVAAFLADGRTDPSLPVKTGWHPLHLAVSAKSSEVVAALLSSPHVDRVSRAPNRLTALEMAIEEGALHLLPILLRKGSGIDPDLASDKGETPLQKAAGSGNLAIAQILLRGGANVGAADVDGDTPLHIASRNGHPALVQLLIKHGAVLDVRNKKEKTPLGLAVLHAQPSVIDYLIESGADVTARESDGWSYAHTAAAAPDTAVLRPLLAAGADANARDRNGWTPLHVAARNGREGACRVLLDSDARIEARSTTGMTPLHVAMLHSHDSAGDLLMKRGADTQVSDIWGWQPIHLAAQSGCEKILKDVLLSYDGRIPSTANVPLTPLQAAAETGQSGIVKLLLAAGADIDASTDSKGPSLALAIKNAQYAVAVELLDAGARADVNDQSGSTVAELLSENLARRAALTEKPSEDEAEVLKRFIDKGLLSEVALTEGTRQSLQSSRRRAEMPSDSIQDSRRRGIANYPWQPAGEDLRAFLLKQLGPVYRKLTVDENSRIHLCSLSWYPGYHLIRIHNPLWSPKSLFLYYLMDGDRKLYRLSGVASPVHEVNANAPVRLNPDNVLDYLVFFCFFVRGEEGGFFILESMDDPLIPHNINPNVRAVFEGTIRRATYEGRNFRGEFLCDAVVSYSNALFIANYAVKPTGEIEMEDDEPIAADLPVRLSAPIA